ncbi:CPBP family intramembrane glutamic endopeptidase [Exiguobacterium flavidum]|uniref:CPBP family intramembrane glutamic endopeptidase n=1 Tax=Exiguobacterium flavidum TaxID=2184695 RepID=UPI000DF7C6F4|nr:type II CAAX endopeptidase family protein [Exiguobacterium flavidum]
MEKRLSYFVGFTYVISWAIWLPNLLLHEPIPLLHLAGGLGPFLGALAATYVIDGKNGLFAYFKDRFLKPFKKRYALLAVILPLMFMGIGLIVVRLFSDDSVPLSDIGRDDKLPLQSAPMIFLTWLLFYGIGEEGGWRGYLFPELRKRMSCHHAALTVSVFWAFWHAPVFLYDPDFSTIGVFGTAGWTIGLVFGSYFLGWLTEKASFSIIPAILFHAVFNYTAAGDVSPMLSALISAQLIAFVLIVFKRENRMNVNK